MTAKPTARCNPCFTALLLTFHRSMLKLNTRGKNELKKKKTAVPKIQCLENSAGNKQSGRVSTRFPWKAGKCARASGPGTALQNAHVREARGPPQEVGKCACATGPRPAPENVGSAHVLQARDAPQEAGKCACVTGPRPARKRWGGNLKTAAWHCLFAQAARFRSGTQATGDSALGPGSYAFGPVFSTALLGSLKVKLNGSRGRKRPLSRGRGNWRSSLASGGGRGWVAGTASGACWVL